jgi:hypothetical protein
MNDTPTLEEVVFRGATIKAFADFGPQEPLVIILAASSIEWMQPDHEDANERGWVSSNEQGIGEFTLEFLDNENHQNAIVQLRAWINEPPQNLIALNSVEQNYIGILDVDSKVSIGRSVSQ